MRKLLERSIFVLAGLSLFVPLILMPSYFIFPFIFPKIIFFRVVVVLMTAAYLLLVWHDQYLYRLRITPINIAMFIYLVSLTISTFVSIDIHRSMWDGHERMLGLFTIAHYVLYYFVLTTVIKKWDGLIRTFLLTGTVVMIIAIIQQFYPNYLLNSGSDRSMSTLGNAIYVSGFGLFLWFLGIIQSVRETNKVWKYGSLFVAMLGFVGIFAGGTRGTVVAIFVSLIILSIVYLLFFWQFKKIRSIAASVLGIIIVCIGIIFLFRNTHMVQKIPAVGRLFNMSLEQTMTTPRVMAWGIAIDTWKEYPTFGIGLNNYIYAFNQHYRSAFLRYGWGETWFDNAHNILLNTLATMGLFGVMVYLGLFAAAIYSLISALKQKRLSVHVAALCLAFLVAHFVHNLFVFESPASYLYFMFMLAFINQLTLPLSELNKKNNTRVIGGGLVGIVSVAAMIIIVITDINSARANNTTLKALQQLFQNPKESIALFEQAKKYNSPHIDDIRHDYTRTVGDALPQYVKIGRVQDANTLFGIAMKSSEENRILHPLDIRIHLTLAQLFEFGADKLGHPEYLKEAEIILLDAQKLSPKRQQIMFALSAIKLRMGDRDSAVLLIEQAFREEPKAAENWLRLALTYLDIGRLDKAKQLVAEARRVEINFTRPNEEVLGRIEKL